MQQITSTSCRATPTVKSFPSKSSYKLTRVFTTFIISLILLSSTLTEAVPTPNKRNNNLADLKLFAQYAAAAYCDSSKFPKWNCGSLCDATDGTIVTKFFTTKKTDLQVYIAKHDKEELIVVGFRGSANFKNALADANIILRDFPSVKGAKVHSGFFKAFLEAQPDVLDEVQKLHEENPTYRIVSTGHSLGGAISVLSALDLVQNLNLIANENLFVFTYGEPRIGDSKLAGFIDSKLKVSRTVNGGDPVARLPPRILDYRHHSGELFLSNPKKSSSNFIQCKGDEDSKCSVSVPVIKLNVGFHMGPYYDISMDTCGNDQNLGEKNFEGLGGNLEDSNF